LRDIKLRYKQTGLGIAWAVLQPLLTMVIFTIIFGGLAKMPSDGVPYPLFFLAAYLPWTLFSDGLTRSTTSMVTNSNIMTKVYFPRMVVPLASIISPLVDFSVSFLILIAMMVYYGYAPTINIVFLPIFLLLALATSFGVGLWLSALNVKYRDFQYTVPFIIQIGMYASPVVYASSLIPVSWRVLYGINPMAGVIDSFRWALLGSGTPNAMVLVSVGMVFLILVSGMFYFRRMEQYYADIV
jgi:lipopolysaccharide transport system permease protein